jgi:hypothetical protein
MTRKERKIEKQQRLIRNTIKEALVYEPKDRDLKMIINDIIADRIKWQLDVTFKHWECEKCKKKTYFFNETPAKTRKHKYTKTCPTVIGVIGYGGSVVYEDTEMVEEFYLCEDCLSKAEACKEKWGI